MGPTPGVETTAIPDEVDEVDAGDVVEGFRVPTCGSEGAFHKLADERIGLGGIHA